MHEELMIRFAQAVAHTLWEGIAIGTLAWVLLRCARRQPVRQHLVLCGALALMAACLPLNLALLASSAQTRAESSQPVFAEPEHRPSAERDALSPLVPSTITPDSRATHGASSEVAPAVENEAGSLRGASAWHHAAPWVAAAYAAGLLAMLARLAIAWGGSRRLRKGAREVREGEWLECWRRAIQQLGVRTAPLLAWSDEVAAPVLIGLCKPMVLLPVALANRLTLAQAEAVLSHELAHLRRHDHWILAAQRLVETLLFYHPVTWWLSRELSRAREQACDDLVLASGAPRDGYAESLVLCSELRLERAGPRTVSTRLAATGRGGNSLRRRVLRVLGQEEPIRPGRAGWWLAGAALFAFLAAGASLVSQIEAAEPGSVPVEGKTPQGEDGSATSRNPGDTDVTNDQASPARNTIGHVFELRPGGRVRWNDNEYRIEDLAEALPEDKQPAKVIVRGSRDARYRDVVALVNLLTSAFGPDITFEIEREEPEGTAEQRERLIELERQIAECEAELESSKLELAELSRTHEEHHPLVRRVKNRIGTVEDYLADLRASRGELKGVAPAPVADEGENLGDFLDLIVEEAELRVLLASGLGAVHPQVLATKRKIAELKAKLPQRENLKNELRLRLAKLEVEQLEGDVAALHATGIGKRHPQIRMKEIRLEVLRDLIAEIEQNVAPAPGKPADDPQEEAPAQDTPPADNGAANEGGPQSSTDWHDNLIGRVTVGPEGARTDGFKIDDH